MDTVIYPYKLQIFIPDDLRKRLKMLAHAKDTSLQKLVVEILTTATEAEMDVHEQARRPASLPSMAKPSRAGY